MQLSRIAHPPRSLLNLPPHIETRLLPESVHRRALALRAQSSLKYAPTINAPRHVTQYLRDTDLIPTDGRWRRNNKSPPMRKDKNGYWRSQTKRLTYAIVINTFGRDCAAWLERCDETMPRQVFLDKLESFGFELEPEPYVEPTPRPEPEPFNPYDYDPATDPDSWFWGPTAKAPPEPEPHTPIPETEFDPLAMKLLEAEIRRLDRVEFVTFLEQRYGTVRPKRMYRQWRGPLLPTGRHIATDVLETLGPSASTLILANEPITRQLLARHMKDIE